MQAARHADHVDHAARSAMSSPQPRRRNSGPPQRRPEFLTPAARWLIRHEGFAVNALVAQR